MLNNTSEKLDTLKEDVDQIKQMLDSKVGGLHTDLENIKTSQTKCESRWSIVDKLMSLTAGGLGISVIASWVQNLYPHSK